NAELLSLVAIEPSSICFFSSLLKHFQCDQCYIYLHPYQSDMAAEWKIPAVNLRALRYFVAIADAGSITAASEIVSVAQPALSRQLRELEADIGVPLLVRGARGVRLTPDGVTFYESAVRVLSETTRVRQQLSVRP